MMPYYVVTYTSVVIEAASEDEALDRVDDLGGGGNWDAMEVWQWQDES